LLGFIAKEFVVNKSVYKLLPGKTGRDKRMSINVPKKFPVLPETLQIIGKLSKRDAKNR